MREMDVCVQMRKDERGDGNNNNKMMMMMMIEEKDEIRTTTATNHYNTTTTTATTFSRFFLMFPSSFCSSLNSTSSCIPLRTPHNNYTCTLVSLFCLFVTHEFSFAHLPAPDPSLRPHPHTDPFARRISSNNNSKSCIPKQPLFNRENTHTTTTTRNNSSKMMR